MARATLPMNVTKIVDHNAEIRELYIESAAPFRFKAGQFVMLHLPEQNGKPVLRAYSIASDARQENGFRLLFKFVDGGVASRYVWNLQAPCQLQMTGPFGRVFFQEPPSSQVIFLNTGSGISQHFSFLSTHGEKYPHVQFHLFFGVRYQADIYYQDEMHRLREKLPNLTYHYVLSRGEEGWLGKKGYVQHHLEDLNWQTEDTTFYLCGNGAMIKSVKAILQEGNFPANRIFAEAFD